MSLCCYRTRKGRTRDETEAIVFGARNSWINAMLRDSFGLDHRTRDREFIEAIIYEI